MTLASPLLQSLVQRATHTVKPEEVSSFLARYQGQDASKINFRKVETQMSNHFRKGCKIGFDERHNNLNVWVGTQLFTVQANPKEEPSDAENLQNQKEPENADQPTSQD